MYTKHTVWHYIIGLLSLVSMIVLLFLPLCSIEYAGKAVTFSCVQLCGKLADVLSSQRNPLLAVMLFVLVLGMALLVFAFLLAFMAPGREKVRDGCAIGAPFLILLPAVGMLLEQEALFSAIGYSAADIAGKSATLWLYILLGLQLALLIAGVWDIFSERLSSVPQNDNEKTVLWHPSADGDSRKERRTGPKNGCLVGKGGVFKGKRYPIRLGQVFTIGRDPDCDIVFPEDCRFIGRRHCAVRLLPKTGKYAVTDYSANGVYLKDETPDLKDARLPQGVAVHLARGAVICLGLDGDAFLLE